jgi:sialate O-acetylesterase
MMKQLWMMGMVCVLMAVDVCAVEEKALLEISPMFGDHAVLQREMPVPVWGWGAPGTVVTVAFAGQQKAATAAEDGKWLVTLDPLTASATPQEMLVSDHTGNQLTLKDILVGEVWVCSGQSNMQYGWGTESLPMYNWGVETNLSVLVPDARQRPIRSYHVPVNVSFTPGEKCNGEWSTDVSGSAVAFGFSYHLQKALDVPVAVIVSCWGSSSIEGWMPRELTEELPHFKAIMEAFDASTNTRDRVQAAIDRGVRHGNVFIRKQPNILYNAMLHPVIPYASRGLVWYQGEANADQPAQYAASLPAWIKRLRTQWGRDDFQFLVVMLPGYGSKGWPWFREVQLGALKLPHTSVANTVDLGDAKNIHPTDKAPICERLALLARRDVYGEQIEAQGPLFKRATTKGNQIVVEFDHGTGLRTTDGASPTGFELASSDLVRLPAAATIQGNTVVLEAEGLATPVFVRYAFAGKPAVNLVNTASQPAYPFRTDADSIGPQ